MKKSRSPVDSLFNFNNDNRLRNKYSGFLFCRYLYRAIFLTDLTEKYIVAYTVYDSYIGETANRRDHIAI